MSMEVLVEETTQKVRSWIADLFGSYEVDRNGSATIRHGSARVFIRVVPYGDDGTVVFLNSWVLLGARRCPELFERISFLNGKESFVSLYTDPNDDHSLVDIGCRIDLLGTFLDREELDVATVAITSVADELDDQLQAEFGGERYHD